jgi:hypothetical protein
MENAPAPAPRIACGIEVAYPTQGPQAYPWGELDQPVTDLAGVPLAGSGTLLSSGARDLQFRFDDRDAAVGAAERIRVAYPRVAITLIEWFEGDDYPTREVL